MSAYRDRADLVLIQVVTILAYHQLLIQVVTILAYHQLMAKAVVFSAVVGEVRTFEYVGVSYRAFDKQLCQFMVECVNTSGVEPHGHQGDGRLLTWPHSVTAYFVNGDAHQMAHLPGRGDSSGLALLERRTLADIGGRHVDKGEIIRDQGAAKLQSIYQHPSSLAHLEVIHGLGGDGFGLGGEIGGLSCLSYGLLGEGMCILRSASGSHFVQGLRSCVGSTLRGIGRYSRRVSSGSGDRSLPKADSSAYQAEYYEPYLRQKYLSLDRNLSIFIGSCGFLLCAFLCILIPWRRAKDRDSTFRMYVFLFFVVAVLGQGSVFLVI